MDDKDMKFTCGKCGHEWLSSDFKDAEEGSKEDYAKDGYNCPECKSTDVSGEDIY